jgi:uncharacterized Zn finger protein
MPIRPCPQCQQPAPRYLPASSEGSSVNYYRCDACGHVWHIPKDKPNAEARAVTIETVQIG